MHGSRNARVQGASAGQSLVEFALVFPIFLLFLFGIVDAGRAILEYNHMSQATRNVARIASTTCFETASPCDLSTGPIHAAIASQGAGLQGAPTWTVKCVDPADGSVPDQVSTFCKVGYAVKVSVGSSFSLLTPIASSFGPVNVGSTTMQEILQ